MNHTAIPLSIDFFGRIDKIPMFMVEVIAKNLILLTGAGFTKNFGGFLADEMWSHIFNNPGVQSSPRLRALLQTNFDFETVYSDVMDDTSITQDDKERMKNSVFEAYRYLDEATKGWVFNDSSPYPVNWYGLNDLLKLFHGSPKETGFFFTLNQDLFMERRSGYRCPGAPHFPGNFYSINGLELETQNFVTLPGSNVDTLGIKNIQDHAGGIVYIKLHGSYGWKSSNGNDKLVIGKNKLGVVKNEPLLKWYFDLFESVIRQGNKKILIIGYGFQDKHINEVLVDGVTNYNLKVFVLSTSPPRSLYDRIQHGHYYAMPILNGLSGYFPYSLLQIFPANQGRTIYLENMVKALQEN